MTSGISRYTTALAGGGLLAGLLLAGGSARAADSAPKPAAWELAVANTEPLTQPQGHRPPLFFWTPDLPAAATDAALETALKALQARGIALYHRWGGTPETTLATYGRVGLLQQKLGMPVAVDGTGVANGFYTSDPALSHLDKDGKPFRDTSLMWQPGCPFAVQARYAEKAKQATAFAQAYKDAGITIDYWAADWEFDGPNEWKDGWNAAKRCTRCRAKIPTIDTDFLAFQKAVRQVRSEMQAEGFVQPLCAVFPAVKIGNYAMNPHDGHRYWWDFYEEKAAGQPFVVDGVPYVKEQNALYRPWADEFAAAGYTVAMPVIYTWFGIYNAYTFDAKPYRWFYGMLREVSSAAKNTPATVPQIPFVHWSTTNPPKTLPDGFVPMDEALYRDLLWHALLRGADSFAMWCGGNEVAVEVKPVQRVYAESLAFNEFIEKGTPVVFDVPAQPGPVVSALQLGRKLLVRRTDFTDTTEPVTLKVGTATVAIPCRPGVTFVVDLP